MRSVMRDLYNFFISFLDDANLYSVIESCKHQSAISTIFKVVLLFFTLQTSSSSPVQFLHTFRGHIILLIYYHTFFNVSLLMNILRKIFPKIEKSDFSSVLTKSTVAVASILMPVIAWGDGSPAYTFLEIPTSSHAYALGGHGIAIIDDDVTLADQNPALIGPELDMQLAFNYMHYMGSGNFAGVRYGMGAGERGAWAFGMRYLSYGSISRYDIDGISSGETFTPTDLVFEGTYAHDFTDRLRGGINLKLTYSNYDARTAIAMAADLGLSYYDDEHDLSLALVVKNAGGQLKRFSDKADRLPFDVQLGYMQGLGSSPISLAITATNLTRWNLPYYTHSSTDGSTMGVLKSNFGSNLFRHLIFGLQYSPSDRFYVALGYNYKTATDMSVYSRSILSGFSLGLGINVKAFGVSASYAMPHKGASSFMFNLDCTLGELLH